MLKTGAFMATLLILGPVTGSPILGRLLILWELWPGESTRPHISRKHLGTSELILSGENELSNIFKNILKNGKLEGYDWKMAWLNNLFNVGEKSQLKKMEQLQIYFENTEDLETRPPLAYVILETNMMLKVEEAHFKKSQESLKTILVLWLVKQKVLRRRKPTEIRMLQKKIYKNNMDRILASVKEREFSKENTYIYNKNKHRIFTDEENTLNAGRKDQHMEFKKYGQLSKGSQQRSNFLRTENMVKKSKTNKKSVTENQKFPFTYVFTHQRSSNGILKIFSAHNTVLSNMAENNHFTLKRKFLRSQHLTRKQDSMLTAKRSKSDKNRLDASSKIYYMELSVINLVFPSITSAMGVGYELLSSRVYKAKSSVCMLEMLKHLMKASQRVKKKYFNIAQNRFRISVLKTEMRRKHHDTESSLPALLYFHKYAFHGPSVVERTKRSAEVKEETVPVSINYLRRLTSALVAGTTVFGIALSALALAACYLYYKRRQLGQFINVVLKGEESQNGAKSTDIPHYTPFSLSQNFHFQSPQELSKNQTPVATVTEAFSKGGSDLVTIKEIYRNSDTEESLNASYKGFSIRSRAYVSQSRSSGSIGSVFDDAPNVSSAQLSSADEVIKENELSVLSNTNPKEKASVSAAYLPYRFSCDYQEHNASYDVLKKPRISKSKSANDIIMSSSSKEMRAVHSVTILHSLQNP